MSFYPRYTFLHFYGCGNDSLWLLDFRRTCWFEELQSEFGPLVGVFVCVLTHGASFEWDYRVFFFIVCNFFFGLELLWHYLLVVELSDNALKYVAPLNMFSRGWICFLVFVCIDDFVAVFLLLFLLRTAFALLLHSSFTMTWLFVYYYKLQ